MDCCSTLHQWASIYGRHKPWIAVQLCIIGHVLIGSVSHGLLFNSALMGIASQESAILSIEYRFLELLEMNHRANSAVHGNF